MLLNTGAVDIGQGSEHRADADLRRGAAGAGRARGDRQPRHRRLAVQLGHHREPRHLRRPAARWSAPPAEVERQAEGSTPARCSSARVDDLELRAGRQGRDQGRAAATQVELRGDLRARPLGRRRPDHRHAHLGVRPEDVRSEARRSPLGLPFPQIGVFSFNAMVVEVEVDTVTGKVRVRRRLVGLRRRPRDQPGDGDRPDRRRVRAGHGLRADRGDGLGRRAARQSEPDGLQDPDDGRAARDAARLPRRVARAERAVRRQERRRDRHQRRRGGDRQRRGRRDRRAPARACR